MNNKHKGLCTGLLAALFLIAACDNPLDTGPADGSPARDDTFSQDPPSLVSTVTFDKNGGTAEAEPREISVTWPDTTVDLPTPPSPPADSGLVFRGWNTSADGSGTRFTAATELSESITVYARWGAPFDTMVTDVADVAEWLSAQSGGSKTSPIPLVLDIDLGDMAGGSPWYALLDALKNAAKYVALDLSDCTMSGTAENGTVFRPNHANVTYNGTVKSVTQTYTGGGKTYIVELTLPLRAKKIFAGWLEGAVTTHVPAFRYFNSLAKIRGDNIEEAYAETGFDTGAIFSGSSSLREASFEKLTASRFFFYKCQNLEYVYCSSLTTIGPGTFYGCTSLQTFDFSNVQSIGSRAFKDCSSLKELDLGQSTVTEIPGETPAGIRSGNLMAAFNGCSNLETIVFPACFTKIGNFVDHLANPSNPPTVGGETFKGCTKVKEVTFLGDPANIDWLESGPPYDTGLDDALITCALSGENPEDRKGTYVKTGDIWSKTP